VGVERSGTVCAKFAASLSRIIWLLLALFLALAPAPALAQVGYDRPGGDYVSVPLRTADPAACAARCERDPRCRAWGFSYPVTESSNAICWLKSRVPPRVAASCCASGVRGTGVIEPRTGEMEFGFDRLGGDLRHFDIGADANGRACQAACEAEPACRAWTYVRPGYVGPSAVCYLKSRITRPVRKPCCISGVVR
jgi:hypothetical protein